MMRREARILFSQSAILSQAEISDFSGISNFKKEKIHDTPPRLTKALLLLHAYLHEDQKGTLGVPADKIQIEHILPKKWDPAYGCGWDKKDAEAYRERLGNKVVIEKPVNIRALNHNFKTKKEIYKDPKKGSKIAAVLELSNYKKDDWTKEDIEEREEKLVSEVYQFFHEQLPNKLGSP